MQERLVNVLIQYRFISLLLVCFVTIVAFAQLSKLQVDNSNESFFLEDDIVRVQLDAFKETFGNDDFIFILVDLEELLDVDQIQRLASFVDELMQEVPHLDEVSWIGNVEAITGTPDGIHITELIDYGVWPDTAQLHSIIQQAAQDPAYRNQLISADGKALGILLEFKSYPAIDPQKESDKKNSASREAPAVIQTILEDFADLPLYVVGIPVMNHYVDAKTEREGPVWMISALLAMCLLLLFTTRSLRGVLVPATTVVLSVIWTLALAAVFGFSLNLMAVMVPTLLLCVGIGDTIHVVAEWGRYKADGATSATALRSSLSKVGNPIILTTLTTASGFLAFMATDLAQLRELGIQAAIGVWVALLLTYLFAIPVLSFGHKVVAQQTNKDRGDIFDRLLMYTSSLVIQYPRLIVGFFILIIAAAFYGVSLLQIETNNIKELPQDDPLRQAFHRVDSRMGGVMSLEVVIDTGKDNGVKAVKVMRAIEQLQTFLDQHPLVAQTNSIVDQIKQMHRAMHENQTDYYRLPDKDSHVAEYLFLYETGGGKQLEQFVSFTYDQARIQIRTKTLGLQELSMLEKSIDAYCEEHLSQFNIYSTGTLPMFRALGERIAMGQLQSLILAFIAIALVMTVVLRSVKLGLIAMIPNIFPVLIAMGMLGLSGAKVNIIMLILAPMILGVAVDDTIHFFFRYRHYFNQYGDYDQAYSATMRSAGRAILFTTVILVAGFSGFLLSDFSGPRTFAWASGLAFFSALLADFMLAPLILRWLKPLGNSHTP